MLAGGVQIQEGPVSQSAIAYVNSNVAHINSIFHVQNSGYHVIAEGKQVVAGTNHFLHLVGHTDNQPYTITVFIPLGNAQPEIIEVSNGHNNFKHGHGYNIEAYHQHHHHHHHQG